MKLDFTNTDTEHLHDLPTLHAEKSGVMVVKA
jgi:hypothetical protein